MYKGNIPEVLLVDLLEGEQGARRKGDEVQRERKKSRRGHFGPSEKSTTEEVKLNTYPETLQLSKKRIPYMKRVWYDLGIQDS